MSKMENKKTQDTQRLKSKKKPVAKAKGKGTRTKGGRGTAAKQEEKMPTSKIVKFIIAMLLLFTGLFLLVSFVSFVINSADNTEAIENGMLWAKETKVANLCGKIGAFVGYYFVNRCFGLPAFFIPTYLVMVGLRLTGTIRRNMVLVFIRMALWMIFLSFVLAAVTHLPIISDFHLMDAVTLGGNIGENLYRMLYDQIGDFGVYGVVALIGLFILIYYSLNTINRVTALLEQSKRLKAIKALSGLGKKGEDDENEEDEVEDDDNNDESDVYNVPDTAGEVHDDRDAARILEFDAKGNLVTGEKPAESPVAQMSDIPFELNGETILPKSADEPVGETEPEEEDLASAFDRVVASQTGNGPALEDETDEPEFTVESAAETELAAVCGI